MVLPGREHGSRDGPLDCPMLMYIGNVSVDDCLLVHDAESGRFVDAVGGSLSWDGQGQNFATMGIDYQYEDGQIRLVTSDYAPTGARQTFLTPEGPACTQFGNPLPLPDGGATEVG